MRTGSLYPPNYDLLSDTVIRSVFRYSRQHHSSYVEYADETKYDIHVLSSPISNSYKSSTVIDPELVAKSQHDKNLASNSDPVVFVADVDHTGDDTLIAQKTLNRVRCGRKNHKQLINDLEDCKLKLQQDIWGLEFYRDAALLSVPTEKNAWSVALQYFRIFRYGLNESAGTKHPCALSFLGTSMTSDVTDGSTCGTEAILDTWKFFSQNFGSILLELDSLERGALEGTLVATTTTSITITRNTLRVVFPHLLSEKRTLFRLACKLIDQRLVMRGQVFFQWNDKTKRVVRIHSQADMVTPMLPIVGNLENVSRVFEGALITPEFNMVPDVSSDSQYWMQLLC